MTKHIQGLKLLLTLFFMVLIINSCGKSDPEPEKNQNPTIANALTALTLSEGFGTQTVNLSTVFQDSDGDNLSFTAKSSETTVVTVSISGVMLTISEVGIGKSNLTITANDGNGGTADVKFSVLVEEKALPNNAPVVSNSLSNLSLDEGFTGETIDISGVFTDADGDNLSFSVASSNESVATASVSGTTLTITEKGNGTTTITLSANDGKGGTANTGFSVTITGTAAATVSFSSQVKPIIDKNCAISGCHVAGTGRADFTVFANIQANATGIKTRTASGNMPKNASPLNDTDKKLIADWVDQGAKNN